MTALKDHGDDDAYVGDTTSDGHDGGNETMVVNMMKC